MQLWWIGVVAAAVIVSSARGSFQPHTSLQLQARLLGAGAPVVLLGGGLLGADGWGEVPTIPALIVTGAQTVAFHRAMNEALLRTLPRAEALELGAGRNSPAAAPDHFVTEWQKFQQRAKAAGAPPAVIKACSLLPKAEVKKIAAPGDELFDMIPPREESLGGQGSACAYSGITIQINPFSPARLEELRKQKGTLWTPVPGLGDAAYLFDNDNPAAGLHYAELYARAGQHVVTIQKSVRPPTASIDTVRPAAIALAKALVAKLP